MKRILVIYWTPDNLGVLQNIRQELNESGFSVMNLQIKYLSNRKSTSLLNLLFIFYQLILINWKIFFYHKVYILGSNAVVFAAPHFIFKRKAIIAHVNELPKFIDKQVLFFSWIERFVVRRIKWLVISNRERLELIRPYLAQDVESFILENILPYHFYYEQKKDIQPKTKKKPPFRFIYAGMISRNRDIAELVAFFKRNDKTEFILVGPVDLDFREAFLASIDGCPNIQWCGVVPFAETQELILASDFGIALYTLSNNNNKYCAPVKIHEYIHQRIPMLVYDNPPLRNLILEYGLAFVVQELPTTPVIDFNNRLAKFYENLDNERFAAFEKASLRDFKSEVARLKSGPLR